MPVTRKVIKSCVLTTLFLTISICFLASCKSQKTTGKSPGTGNDNIKKSDVNQKAATVINTARSYLGTSYKYGGSSRAGMDCSGLVITAFNSANIQLPRTSQEMSKTGRTVSINELQAGDLVFFAEKKGTNTISHVGIVTEKKNNEIIIFIHSTTKAGVIEDNLFNPYWRPLFIKAVRII
ncbi:MAG: C40 family peptidase [Cytophagaceae bacterium]